MTGAGSSGFGALVSRRPVLLDSAVAYKGGLIEVRVDRLALPNGKVVEREIVEHPGAVVVAALDEQRRVVLVHQYRSALRRELLELPAGLLEPGEEPARAAARELREETGLTAARWDALGHFYSSPGFVHEKLHAFLARELRPAEQELDEDEDIELEWVSLDDLLARPETIEDAKTLATLLLVGGLLGQGR